MPLRRGIGPSGTYTIKGSIPAQLNVAGVPIRVTPPQNSLFRGLLRASNLRGLSRPLFQLARRITQFVRRDLPNASRLARQVLEQQASDRLDRRIIASSGPAGFRNLREYQQYRSVLRRRYYLELTRLYSDLLLGLARSLCPIDTGLLISSLYIDGPFLGSVSSEAEIYEIKATSMVYYHIYVEGRVGFASEARRRALSQLPALRQIAYQRALLYANSIFRR